MFKKLLLLSFVVIAVPNCMIYSTTKKDMEKKINGTCNIPDLLTTALAKNPEACTFTNKEVEKNIDAVADDLTDLIVVLATSQKVHTLISNINGLLDSLIALPTKKEQQVSIKKSEQLLQFKVAIKLFTKKETIPDLESILNKLENIHNKMVSFLEKN